MLGAYTHGGISGITKATEENRDLARAVNRAFRETRKHDTWAAVTIMRTPTVRVHSDNHNAPGSSNHIRAIAGDKDVKVWIEDKGGDVEVAYGKEGCDRIRGHAEDATQAVVSFDPKKKHTVMSERVLAHYRVHPKGAREAVRRTGEGAAVAGLPYT